MAIKFMNKKIWIFTVVILLGISVGAKDWNNKAKRVEFRDISKTDYRGNRPLSIGDVDNVSIDAIWNNGTLVVCFDEPEGSAIIEFLSMYSNESTSFNVDTSIPVSVNIGYPDEPIRIEMSTSAGNAYEGYLIID